MKKEIETQATQSQPEPLEVLVPTTIRLRPQVRGELTAIAKARGMTLGAYLRWVAEEQVCYAQVA